MDKTKEFGVRLRVLRLQTGMTQRELAGLVNIDFTYLSKIENGVLPPPSDKVILQLAEALHADRDELITLAGRIPADIVEILRDREALQQLRSDRTQKKVKASSRRSISMPKLAIPLKNIYRVAIPLFLMITVAASLWYASPTQALEMSFPTLPSGDVGTEHSFSLKIEITDAELLPVTSLNMEIYYVSDTSKKATCTGMPMTSTTRDYTTAETGGGAVSVTATPASGWAYQTTGGGYVIWQETVYNLNTKGGYAYSGTGTVAVDYDITWTSPSSWPSGQYKAKVDIVANGETFSETSDTFSLTEETVAVVAAGAGGAAPGVTIVSEVVNYQGVFTAKTTARSQDSNAKVTIAKGTLGQTNIGRRLTQIKITQNVSPPPPPADANVVGITYDFGPDGATFDPPITLTLTYDPADVPAGVDEANMVLAYWDSTAGESGEWVVLEGCVVDLANNTISAPVSHFTDFTVVAYTSPAAFAASDLTVTPAEVNVGESVAISITITNTGDLGGSYEATLLINGVVVATEEVTLEGKASQEVTFTTAQSVVGNYQVAISDVSGTFVVKAVPTPTVTPTLTPTVTPTPVPTITPAPPTTPVPTVPPTVTPTTPPSAPVTPMNWWLIGGIIAVAVIAVALAAWLIIVRRSRGH